MGTKGPKTISTVVHITQRCDNALQIFVLSRPKSQIFFSASGIEPAPLASEPGISHHFNQYHNPLVNSSIKQFNNQQTSLIN